MLLTPKSLTVCCPTLIAPERLMGPMEDAFRAAEIVTPAQEAMFVAQAAHETGEFRNLVELWGPTAQQETYAGRMGNKTPAQAFLYRGRGWFQLTGHDNYALFGHLLGLPLEDHPEMVARQDIAAKTAALYWTRNHLGPLAEAQDVNKVTRIINGGSNGLADRAARFFKLLAALTLTLACQTDKTKEAHQDLTASSNAQEQVIVTEASHAVETQDETVHLETGRWERVTDVQVDAVPASSSSPARPARRVRVVEKHEPAKLVIESAQTSTATEAMTSTTVAAEEEHQAAEVKTLEVKKVDVGPGWHFYLYITALIIGVLGLAYFYKKVMP